MKRTTSVLVLWLCMACLVVSMPTGALGQTKEEAIKDWSALCRTHEAFRKKIKDVVPSYKAVIIGQDHDKILVLLADVETNDLPKIKAQLDAFSKKYGSDSSAIDRKMTDLVRDRKEQPEGDAGTAFRELSRWVKNIPEARKAKAGEVFRKTKQIDDRIKLSKTHVRKGDYDELRSTLQLVLRYDPEHAEAKARLGRVDTDQKEAFAAVEKGIDEGKWPPHVPDFAGPGTPDELAGACMDYFRKNPTKKAKPDHTVAVSIRGQWYSFKKNIVGETIQWGLPIYAACYNDDEEKRDEARVFSLTMLTQEERGVKKAPPWLGVTVGDLYKMRLSKIRPGGARRGRTTGGVSGRLFWLALALANLVAGLLAAAPLLKPKVPQLGVVYDKITPLRNLLGVIALAVGVVCFLRAMLFCGFAIFADLLPQISVVVAGLFLGKEMLLKKPTEAKPADEEEKPDEEKEDEEKEDDAEESITEKGTEAAGAAVGKAQDILSKHADKIEMLEKYQVPIGIACIALGLLHLLIGSTFLF